MLLQLKIAYECLSIKQSVRPLAVFFEGAEFRWNLLLAGAGHPDLIVSLLGPL
jgi:hypothetical protein